MRNHFPSQKRICIICGKGFLENYILKCHLLKAHQITVNSQSCNEPITENMTGVSQRVDCEPQTENVLTDTGNDTETIDL